MLHLSNMLTPGLRITTKLPSTSTSNVTACESVFNVADLGVFDKPANLTRSNQDFVGYDEFSSIDRLVRTLFLNSKSK